MKKDIVIKTIGFNEHSMMKMIPNIFEILNQNKANYVVKID